MSRFLIASLLVAVSGAVSADDSAYDDVRIEAQLASLAVGAHRPADHVARNAARHPVETLMYFGLKPDMTVV